MTKKKGKILRGKLSDRDKIIAVSIAHAEIACEEICKKIFRMIDSEQVVKIAGLPKPARKVCTAAIGKSIAKRLDIFFEDQERKGHIHS